MLHAAGPRVPRRPTPDNTTCTSPCARCNMSHVAVLCAATRGAAAGNRRRHAPPASLDRRAR
eukprot:15467136-Alexandrium_andersonii.AAC.1